MMFSLCRALIVSLLCAVPYLTYAAADVPLLGFPQQVEIVVETKKDPRILELKLEQKEDMIHIVMIVDRNQDREEVKELALNVVMLTKMRSMDDPPKTKDKPGKGLYNYEVQISRPDGVALLTALKPKAKSGLQFEDRILHTQPLTRAGATYQ